MNPRAITYRRLHDIPESWGTAVNVQAMVFGNMGETSATGVAFTRNPSTGDQLLHPTIEPGASREIIGVGLPASPGAATGEIVFSSNDAEELKAQGRKAI